MVSIRISKKLKARPDWTEMVERGFIPEEMFVMQEEFETKRRWKIYQQQQRNQRLLLQQQQQQQQQQQREEQEEENEQYSYYRKQPDQRRQCEPMQVDGVHPFDIDSNTDHRSHQQPMQESNSPSSISFSSSLLPLPEGSTTTTAAGARTQRQKKSISNVLIPKIKLLRKAMDRDRLSRLVQRRPSPSELNQSPKTATVLHAYHLIAYASTSKDLVPLTTQLNFLLKGERLGHWLYHQRPSLAVVMNERHMLRTEVRTAWMVCPGVSKKVRFYEGLIQESRDYEQQLHDFFFQQQQQQQQRQQQQQQQQQQRQQQQQQQQAHPQQQHLELVSLAVS
jgi:hypothetical protein